MKTFANPADVILNKNLKVDADETSAATTKTAKKSYLLKIPQDIFTKVNKKAMDEGRSFNSYVNWLLKKDLEQ